MHGPKAAVLVPFGRGDVLAEVDVLAEPEFLNHGTQVALEFLLAGKHPGYLEVQEVAVAVDQGLRVACGTGIGVLAPYASHIVAALEDQEVLDAFLDELGSLAQAAEAGPDDDCAVDVVICGGHDVLSLELECGWLGKGDDLAQCVAAVERVHGAVDFFERDSV